MLCQQNFWRVWMGVVLMSNTDAHGCTRMVLACVDGGGFDVEHGCTRMVLACVDGGDDCLFWFLVIMAICLIKVLILSCLIRCSQGDYVCQNANVADTY